jgi:hypothetical protein
LGYPEEFGCGRLGQPPGLDGISQQGHHPGAQPQIFSYGRIVLYGLENVFMQGFHGAPLSLSIAA